MKGHIRRRTREDGSTAYQVRWLDAGEENLKTFDRLKDAKTWLADRQAASLRGDLISPELASTTFGELVDAWRASWDGRLQPRTMARYDEVLRTHLLPALDRRPVKDISTQWIQEFVRGLSAQGLAPGTVRKVHSVLSAVFAEALRMGTVRHNPAKGVRLPRVERRDMLFLDSREVETLATECGQVPGYGRPAWSLAVRLAAYTGLRAGEQWALRRRDVDLLHRRLIISRALKDVRGTLEFGPTKTHQSRAVVFPRSLVPALEAQLASTPASPDALLFTGAYGAPVRHNLFVRRVFRPASAVLGDNAAVRWHDLRHTYASLAAAAGASAKDVQAQLGHSSVTMTLDRYTHLFPAQADALADRLDSLLTVDRRSGEAV